jgi:hypothetical protein
MYPLPDQPEPKPARLRPLPDMRPVAPVPLSAPVPDMPLSAPLAPEVRPARGRDAAADPATGPSGGQGRPGAGWAPDCDQQRDQIRRGMDELAARAMAASSWLESSRHYSQLLNRDGIVPVTARLTAGDLAFLAEAREQMLQFTELTVRLMDLHQPLDAGGITTDPSSPIRRCRSCMWRWPCPTFSILAEVVDRPPAG